MICSVLYTHKIIIFIEYQPESPRKPMIIYLISMHCLNSYGEWTIHSILTNLQCWAIVFTVNNITLKLLKMHWKCSIKIRIVLTDVLFIYNLCDSLMTFLIGSWPRHVTSTNELSIKIPDSGLRKILVKLMIHVTSSV